MLYLLMVSDAVMDDVRVSRECLVPSLVSDDVVAVDVPIEYEGYVIDGFAPYGAHFVEDMTLDFVSV